MLDTIKAFFLVLFLEFPLNFIPIYGFMIAMKAVKKKDNAFFNIYAFLAASTSVILIALFEPLKLSVTTLGPPVIFSERLPFIASGTVIFYVFFWLFTKYYTAPWSNNDFDTKLGMLFAIIISFLEVIMLILDGSADTVPWARIITHTLSQIIAFPLAIRGLRYISKLEGIKQLSLTIGVALVMSIAITIVDYVPYFK